MIFNIENEEDIWIQAGPSSDHMENTFGQIMFS